ncbi:GntR family transcriptional regulator [Jiella sonneratiae]|uniref:GntR family transcriptional regulator n=1 Tax=Jiella sonneratiae TaxID=2816856 RepID=A0ABS3J583_9HYPH|nr:GntR family transcriptional regulator [Jiella sonneratiae]MBO0904834.1 GntR family transcriptional regulator [Jiella sonneratiae]
MIETPIQRRHRLANQILDVIRDARFEPGHHLREQALSDLLEVSRTPVRAALQLLAERGILEAKRNQGFFLKAHPNDISRLDVEIPATSDQDLYSQIVRDRLAERLPASFLQSDVARRYDVDRATFQRTLARLVDDGLLQKNAGRGWSFMPTLNTDLGLRSSYEFRRIVEPSSFGLTTFRVDASAAERARLQHLYLISHPDLGEVDRRQLFETDAQFHEMLAEFSGNPFCLQAIQQQNRMRRLLEFGSYSNRRRVKDWCREHLAILDAVTKGETRRAAELMVLHLDNAFGVAPSLAAAKARGSREGSADSGGSPPDAANALPHPHAS